MEIPRPAAVPLLLFVLMTSAVTDSECRLFSDSASRVRRFLKHLQPVQEHIPSDWTTTTAGAVESDFVKVGAATLSYAAFQAQAPAPSSGGCPPKVTDCDFYFQGSRDNIPSFSLATTQPDTPFTPPINTSASDTITVGPINTFKAEYICTADAPPPDDQFYVTQESALARTFHGNNSALAYANQIVKLKFSSVQLQSMGATMNLNTNDGDTQFPEAKRCILFQTTV